MPVDPGLLGPVLRGGDGDGAHAVPDVGWHNGLKWARFGHNTGRRRKACWVVVGGRW